MSTETKPLAASVRAAIAIQDGFEAEFIRIKGNAYRNFARDIDDEFRPLVETIEWAMEALDGEYGEEYGYCIFGCGQYETDKRRPHTDACPLVTLRAILSRIKGE